MQQLRLRNLVPLALVLLASTGCSLISGFSDYEFPADAGPETGDASGAGSGGGETGGTGGGETTDGGGETGGSGGPQAGGGGETGGSGGGPQAGGGGETGGTGGGETGGSGGDGTGGSGGGAQDAGPDAAEPPPCTPTGEEVCDGEDNDCDPDTEDGADEDGFGEPCDGEDADLCEDGRQVCDGTNLVCDDDANSAAELCDGEDNDCNSETEDGAHETDLYAPCDGDDNDRCEEGEWVCDGGPGLTCSDNTGDLLDVCDGEDNDCNSDTEDGADEEGFGDPCDGEDTDLCEDGQIICNGSALLCDDDTDSIAELCDGEDNDCNSDTADGADEPELNNLCDGPDTDFCEEGVIICNSSGALDCSDTTGDNVEVCDDSGQDEDCDGFVLPRCLPPLNEEFPGPLGAAAAQDVFFDFDPPGIADWKLVCRTAKPEEIDTAEWGDCQSGNSLTVRPWSPAQSTDPDNNGRWLTQVRFQWSDDDFTMTFSRQYYVHNSLHGVMICQRLVPDFFDLMGEYFRAAAERLVRDDTPRFDPETGLQLGNPFIQIRFSPPVDGSFEVNDGDGEVEVLSLRKRFVLEPNDGQLVLMYRAYEARRVESCFAATTHKHEEGSHPSYGYGHYNNNCDAIVLNQQGAGVCLTSAGGSVEFAIKPTGLAQGVFGRNAAVDFSQYYCTGSTGDDICADNFMWRKLVRRRRPQEDPPGPMRWFSPKCFGDPTCADADPTVILYLPDRALYPDIFP